MSFITQNANIALLFLIVLASAGLVAATLYFQANFTKINDAYDSKLEELNHVTQELEAQKKTLAEVSSEAEMKKKREEEIAGKFGEVKTAKETLEQEKTTLEKKASSLEGLVGDLKKDNDKLNSEVGRYKGESEQYQAFYSKCNKELADANYFLRQLKEYRDRCAATCP